MTAENIFDDYDTSIRSTGTVTATSSQTGSGQISTDSTIIGTRDHPEHDFDWDFEITPSDSLPKAGLFVHDLDADLSIKSALVNSVAISGTSPTFRGSASTSLKGNAISYAVKHHDILSVMTDGSAQVKGSVRSPGEASGESAIESVLFRNVQTGVAGAYLDLDTISVPITESEEVSRVGGSLLRDQFSAQGVQASSSGSVKGSTWSARSPTEYMRDATTASTSEGTLSGTVSCTNGAGANTAGLLGSVHATGLTGPGFENSLFDASVLITESNAADTIDTTGTATGTVTGTTKADSQQSETTVQKSTSGSFVNGQATTSVNAQKGTGLAVAGLGSISIVQPVQDPNNPVATVNNADGGVSYAYARGEDPAARITGSSDVTGSASSAGSVKFYAPGYDPFTLTTNGQLIISKIPTRVEARTNSEAEAIGFGFTAQRATMTGNDGISEGYAGFGTGAVTSDDAQVKADAAIKRIDLANVATVDTPGATTPPEISITFINGVSTSKLDSFRNIGDTMTETSPFAITYNPDPDAGGTADGALVRSSDVVTDSNPNIARGYIEGIAGSAAPIPPDLDLNLVPLLFGFSP